MNNLQPDIKEGDLLVCQCHPQEKAIFLVLELYYHNHKRRIRILDLKMNSEWRVAAIRSGIDPMYGSWELMPATRQQCSEEEEEKKRTGEDTALFHCLLTR